MPHHDYSPQQALELLMRKLKGRDETLAAEVQRAVDAGKDVQELEPSSKRRKKTRAYRKTAPFSYAEAFEAALAALEAYFVDQPYFVDSCLDDLTWAALGRSGDRYAPHFQPDLEDVGREKAVEFERRTETQLTESAQETLRLRRIPVEGIGEQRDNFARLAELGDFGER